MLRCTIGAGVLVALFVGVTPVHAGVVAPPFDRVTTYQRCEGSARCAVSHRADRNGAFALGAVLVSPRRGRQPGDGIAATSTDLDTSEFVPGPTGRVDVLARVHLRSVSTAGTSAHLGPPHGFVSLRVSSPDCPYSRGCTASDALYFLGAADETVFLKASLADLYYRDMPSRRLDIRVTGGVLTGMVGETGRQQVQMRASRTTVEVIRQPPARHEFAAARFIGANGFVQNGPADRCTSAAGMGVAGACFVAPPDAVYVSGRVTPDSGDGSAIRIQFLARDGRFLYAATIPCGETAVEYLYDPFTRIKVDRVVVQPVSYAGCASPWPTGTATVDFTIPPP